MDIVKVDLQLVQKISKRHFQKMLKNPFNNLLQWVQNLAIFILFKISQARNWYSNFILVAFDYFENIFPRMTILSWLRVRTPMKFPDFDVLY